MESFDPLLRHANGVVLCFVVEDSSRTSDLETLVDQFSTCEKSILVIFVEKGDSPLSEDQRFSLLQKLPQKRVVSTLHTGKWSHALIPNAHLHAPHSSLLPRHLSRGRWCPHPAPVRQSGFSLSSRETRSLPSRPLLQGFGWASGDRSPRRGQLPCALTHSLTHSHTHTHTHTFSIFLCHSLHKFVSPSPLLHLQ